jgi:hypothetical protein
MFENFQFSRLGNHLCGREREREREKKQEKQRGGQSGMG